MKATTLFAILKDIVVCHFNLPIDMCHGQRYDGAANIWVSTMGSRLSRSRKNPERSTYTVWCLSLIVAGLEPQTGHVLRLFEHDK